MGICLLLWKHQKPKTEAFSRDFLEEVDKLSTERSFVSDLFGGVWVEINSRDPLPLSSRNGALHKI